MVAAESPATLLHYPSWLRLEQPLGEFLMMSVVGNLAYGTTLAEVSRVALRWRIL